MMADVAYEIADDAPLREAPPPFAALETIVVATAHDRLKRQQWLTPYVRRAREAGADRVGGRHACLR